MIELREYSANDFYTVASWWIEQQGVILNKDLLSETGFVAKAGDKDLAALFLFPVLGSKVCWIGWPISDPNSSSETRSEALDMLFNACHTKAKEMGYKLIWTTSGIPAVESRLTKHGYIQNDENINQYWKGLD